MGEASLSKFLLCRQDVRQHALDEEGNKPTGGWLSQLGYLYPPGAEDTITAITHWVCVDPNTKVCTSFLPHQTSLAYVTLDQTSWRMRH